MSLIVDLCEAVVTSLNAGTFSKSFTASREYSPRQPLAALGNDDIGVFILPRSLDPNYAASTRDESPATLTILVAIYSKIGIDSQGKYVTADVDAMYELVEEIITHFLNNIEQGDAVLSDIKPFNSLLSDMEKMETQRLFESVLKVEFETLMGG